MLLAVGIASLIVKSQPDNIKISIFDMICWAAIVCSFSASAFLMMIWRADYIYDKNREKRYQKQNEMPSTLERKII